METTERTWAFPKFLVDGLDRALRAAERLAAVKEAAERRHRAEMDAFASSRLREMEKDPGTAEAGALGSFRLTDTGPVSDLPGRGAAVESIRNEQTPSADPSA